MPLNDPELPVDDVETKARAGRRATRTAGRFSHFGGMTVDKLGRRWDGSKHPRDARGRFIETGGTVRTFGGKLGKVIRALGGPRGREKVLVEFGDGHREAEFANRVTMVKRPDGTSPIKADAPNAKERVLEEDARREAAPHRGDGLTADDPGDLDGNGIPDHLEQGKPLAAGKPVGPSVKSVRDRWRSGQVTETLDGSPVVPGHLARRADQIQSAQLSPRGSFLVARENNSWKVFHSATGSTVAGSPGDRLTSKPEALALARALEDAQVDGQPFDWDSPGVRKRIEANTAGFDKAVAGARDAAAADLASQPAPGVAPARPGEILWRGTSSSQMSPDDNFVRVTTPLGAVQDVPRSTVEEVSPGVYRPLRQQVIQDQQQPPAPAREPVTIHPAVQQPGYAIPPRPEPQQAAPAVDQQNVPAPLAPEAPREPVRPQGRDLLPDAPAEPVRPTPEPGEVLHGPGPVDAGGDHLAGGRPGRGGEAAGRGHDGQAGPADERPASGGGAGAAGAGLQPAAGAGDGGQRAGGRPAATGRAPGGVAQGKPGPRFRPRSQADLAPAGKKAKARTNVTAVRLLKQLEDEGRQPTPAEQQVLARWSGWGSVPEVFQRRPGFEALHDELRALLSDEEWRAAERNTLNAHYTDAGLVEAIWQAVEDLGVQKGEVLEPGSGIGTFIGKAPDGVHVTGVEVDPTTARISQLLYPQATIRNEGFEKTNIPSGTFDAVVGNVPFGDYRLPGTQHSIHNYFIGKSIDEVAPGGVVAVISSRYSMDGKKARAAREEWAAKADLLGAVRLPGGAHERAAGTQVVTDVLLFRKRAAGDPAGDTSWVDTRETLLDDGNAAEVNAYFADHPENIIGTTGLGRGMNRQDELMVTGPKDASLELAQRLDRIVADAKSSGRAANPDQGGDERVPMLQYADAGDRSEGHVQYGDQVFERTVTVGADGKPLKKPRREKTQFTVVEDGVAVPLFIPQTQVKETVALGEIRDAAVRLLDMESTSRVDTPALAAQRRKLNELYDAYVAKWGSISRFDWGSRKVKELDPETDEPTGRLIESQFRRNPPAIARFKQDPSSAVVFALEDDFDPETQTAKKTRIMSERVVQRREFPTSASSAGDALAIVQDSVGRPDLPSIARMLGVDEDEARRQLGNLVFDEPGTGRLVARAEYLSGDVRAKLREAQEAAQGDPRFNANVAELADVVPDDLTPADIEGRLGSPWIPDTDVQAFVREITEDSSATVKKEYGEWKVTGGRTGDGTPASTTWGTRRRSAYDLVESLLNGRVISVADKDATGKSHKNPEATTAAQAKADALKDKFSSWLWEDDARATRLTRDYNDRFNNLALRSYDDADLKLPGLVANWTMRGHQKAAIARIVNEPTALLAHEVGAGKTAEMVAGTMELRRLGLAKKPAIVIPNHMLEQFSREFLQLYPNAKVLVAGSKDLEGKRRRLFTARAATGDWDAVILTQGAFKAIPMSVEAQKSYLYAQLDDLRRAVEAAEARGEKSQSFKRMQKRLANLETKIQERLEKAGADKGGVTWEQTGIDYLMVDEAHLYKNLSLPTSDQSLAVEGSVRAADLDMKLHHLRQNSASGRVATFATATPISNSMGEMYVMTRYLRPDLLEAAQIKSFDEWIASFADKVTKTEMSVDGGSFKQKSRFARFTNAPELIRMFRTFTDVKTADDLGLPTPDVKGTPDEPGSTENVVAEASDELAEYIASLGERAEKVASGKVDPAVDNMLKISSDGRKAALDMRLVGGRGGGKIDKAADRIASIYDANKDKVFKVKKGSDQDAGEPGALQMVFADLGTPTSDGRWNVYDELKDQLAARGVPRDKIRYIHDAGNDQEKAQLFADARAGKVAVLIGSTEKMGVGTNVQNRAVALHHLDAPWRPADVAQRDGRVVRQGNQNDQVEVIRYLTEGSFDGFMWGVLTRKASFIGQAMSGDLEQRDFEDIGDSELSAAQAMALASGNPLLLEKADVDADLQKLSRLEKAHAAEQRAYRSGVTQNEAMAAQAAQHAQLFDAAIAKREPEPDGDAFAITVNGRKITKKGEAGDSLRNAAGQVLLDLRFGIGERQVIGRFRGLDITAQARMKAGTSTKVVSIGLADVPDSYADFTADDLSGKGSGLGIITRLSNRLAELEDYRDGARNWEKRAKAAAAKAKDGIGKPFPLADRLATAQRRADILDRLIAAQGNSETEEGKKRAEDLTRQYNAAREADVQLAAASRPLKKVKKAPTGKRTPPPAAPSPAETSEPAGRVTMTPEDVAADLMRLTATPQGRADVDKAEDRVPDAAPEPTPSAPEAPAAPKWTGTPEELAQSLVDAGVPEEDAQAAAEQVAERATPEGAPESPEAPQAPETDSAGGGSGSSGGRGAGSVSEPGGPDQPIVPSQRGRLDERAARLDAEAGDDLHRLVDAYQNREQVEAAGFSFDTIPGNVKVGDEVVAFSRGRFRRGRVTKVGKTNLEFAYTTQGALDEARRLREQRSAKQETPEQIRARYRESGHRQWDWQKRTADTPVDEAKIRAEEERSNWVKDSDRQASIRRRIEVGGKERARAQKWIAEHPDREAYADQHDAVHRDRELRYRDNLREFGPGVDMINATRTRKSVKIAEVARRRDAAATEAPNAPETPPEPDAGRVEMTPEQVNADLASLTPEATPDATPESAQAPDVVEPATESVPEPAAAAAPEEPAPTATPAAGEALGQLSQLEQARIRHAVDDWAAYYSPGGTPERYVAEGPLKDLTDVHGLSAIAAAVREQIDATPGVLDKRVSDKDRQQRARQRLAESDRIGAQVGEAVQAGDFERALELVDQAEMLAPGARDYDRARNQIRKQAAARPADAQPPEAAPSAEPSTEAPVAAPERPAIAGVHPTADVGPMGLVMEPSGPYTMPWQETTYRTNAAGMDELAVVLQNVPAGTDPGFRLRGKTQVVVTDPARARFEIDGPRQVAFDNASDEPDPMLRKRAAAKSDALRKLMNAISADKRRYYDEAGPAPAGETAPERPQAPAAPEIPAAPKTPAGRTPKPKKADEVVLHEQYGNVSRAQLAAYRKHNVPPATHDELVGHYGDDHAAITAAVKDPANQRPEGGGFDSVLWRDNLAAAGEAEGTRPPRITRPLAPRGGRAGTEAPSEPSPSTAPAAPTPAVPSAPAAGRLNPAPEQARKVVAQVDPADENAVDITAEGLDDAGWKGRAVRDPRRGGWTVTDGDGQQVGKVQDRFSAIELLADHYGDVADLESEIRRVDGGRAARMSSDRSAKRAAGATPAPERAPAAPEAPQAPAAPEEPADRVTAAADDVAAELEAIGTPPDAIDDIMRRVRDAHDQAVQSPPEGRDRGEAGSTLTAGNAEWGGRATVREQGGTTVEPLADDPADTWQNAMRALNDGDLRAARMKVAAAAITPGKDDRALQQQRVAWMDRELQRRGEDRRETDWALSWFEDNRLPLNTPEQRRQAVDKLAARMFRDGRLDDADAQRDFATSKFLLQRIGRMDVADAVTKLLLADVRKQRDPSKANTSARRAAAQKVRDLAKEDHPIDRRSYGYRAAEAWWKKTQADHPGDPAARLAALDQQIANETAAKERMEQQAREGAPTIHVGALHEQDMLGALRRFRTSAKAEKDTDDARTAAAADPETAGDVDQPLDVAEAPGVGVDESTEGLEPPAGREGPDPKPSPDVMAAIERGEPVALPGEKFAPTRQQQDVYDAVLAGLDVKVQAGAGSGKTSTLEALARRLAAAFPGKRIAYATFNKEIQVEAERRMPGNTESRTGHSLAYAWAGGAKSKEWMKKFAKGNPKGLLRRADRVAAHLGIREPLPAREGAKGLDSTRQAMAVMRTVDRFASSADDAISAAHLPDNVRETLTGEGEARLLELANRAWEDIQADDGRLKPSLDHMRKMWALTRPDFTKSGSGWKQAADVLFVDEAQDTPPVMAKVYADQNMTKIIVGDQDQAIYGFTGAVDYLDTADADVSLPLTKSWRYGPQVADIGNRFLQLVKSPKRVEGGGPESLILPPGEMEEADAVLVRTNSGALSEIQRELEAGRKVGVTKGTRADLLNLIDSAAFLKGQGDAPMPMHEDLEVYNTWQELEEAAEEGDTTAKMISRIFSDRTIDELRELVGRVIEPADDPLTNVQVREDDDSLTLSGRGTAPLTAALKSRHGQGIGGFGFRWDRDSRKWEALGKTPEARQENLARLREAAAVIQGDKPDVTVSTAHKAKGLEWDRVRIGSDHRQPKRDESGAIVEMPEPEELRLSYVAVTRAKKELDPGSLGWVYEATQKNGGDPDELAADAAAAAPEPDRVTVEPEAVRRDLEDIGADVPENVADAEQRAPEPEATPEPEAAPAAPEVPEPAAPAAPEPSAPAATPATGDEALRREFGDLSDADLRTARNAVSEDLADPLLEQERGRNQERLDWIDGEIARRVQDRGPEPTPEPTPEPERAPEPSVPEPTPEPERAPETAPAPVPAEPERAPEPQREPEPERAPEPAAPEPAREPVAPQAPETPREEDRVPGEPGEPGGPGEAPSVPGEQPDRPNVPEQRDETDRQGGRRRPVRSAVRHANDLGGADALNGADGLDNPGLAGLLAAFPMSADDAARQFAAAVTLPQPRDLKPTDVIVGDVVQGRSPGGGLGKVMAETITVQGLGSRALVKGRDARGRRAWVRTDSKTPLKLVARPEGGPQVPAVGRDVIDDQVVGEGGGQILVSQLRDGDVLRFGRRRTRVVGTPEEWTTPGGERMSRWTEDTGGQFDMYQDEPVEVVERRPAPAATAAAPSAPSAPKTPAAPGAPRAAGEAAGDLIGGRTRAELDGMTWDDITALSHDVADDDAEFDRLLEYIDGRDQAERSAAAAVPTPRAAEGTPVGGVRLPDGGTGTVRDAAEMGGYAAGGKFPAKTRQMLGREVAGLNRDVLDRLVRANPNGGATSIEDAGSLLGLLSRTTERELLRGRQIPLSSFLNRDGRTKAARAKVHPSLREEDTLHLFGMTRNELAAAARDKKKWGLPGAASYDQHVRDYDAARDREGVDGRDLGTDLPGGEALNPAADDTQPGGISLAAPRRSPEDTQPGGITLAPARADATTRPGGIRLAPNRVPAPREADTAPLRLVDAAAADARRAAFADASDGWTDLPGEHVRAGDLVRGRAGELREVVDVRPEARDGRDGTLLTLKDGDQRVQEWGPAGGRVSVNAAVGQAIDLGQGPRAGGRRVDGDGLVVPDGDPGTVAGLGRDGAPDAGQWRDLTAGGGSHVQVTTRDGRVVAGFAGRALDGSGISLVNGTDRTVVQPDEVASVRVLSGRAQVRGGMVAPSQVPLGSRVVLDGTPDRRGELVARGDGFGIRAGMRTIPVPEGARVAPLVGHAPAGVEQGNGLAPGVWGRSARGMLLASSPGEWDATIVPRRDGSVSWRVQHGLTEAHGTAASVGEAKKAIRKRLADGPKQGRPRFLPRDDAHYAANTQVPDEAPPTIGGLSAEWAPATGLNIGDRARVTGWSAGDQASYAGHVVGSTPVLVDRGDGRVEPMLAVTLAEDPAGQTGWRGTVLTSLDALASRVPSASDGDLPTQSTLDVLSDRMPAQLPQDPAGHALFPGALVREAGGRGRSGIVTQARRADVSVQWSDGRVSDMSGAGLRVTNAGAARPQGWTRDGQRVTPGMVLEHAGGRGIVESVDGDRATVTMPDGIRSVQVGDARVVGQVAPGRPDQVPDAVDVAEVRQPTAGDLKEGDRIILTDGAGRPFAAHVDGVEVDGYRRLIDYTDPRDGTRGMVDADRSEVFDSAVGSDGKPIPLDDAGPGETPTILPQQVADLPAPDGPTTMPVLNRGHVDLVNILGLDLDGVTVPDAAHGAARLRAGDELTGREARALAEAVRAASRADGASPGRARSLQRAADRLDAAAGKVAGDKAAAGPVPDLGRGEAGLSGPRDLAVGDVVAFPVPDGPMLVGRMVAARQFAGGRLWQVTVDSDGRRERRIVADGGKVWRLPDLMEPVDVAPGPGRLLDGEETAPGRVTEDRLRELEEAYLQQRQIAAGAAAAAVDARSINELRENVAQALTVEAIEQAARDADQATRDAARQAILDTVNEADPLPGESPEQTAARVSQLVLDAADAARTAQLDVERARAARDRVDDDTDRRAPSAPLEDRAARDAATGAVDATVDEVTGVLLPQAPATPATAAQVDDLVRQADQAITRGHGRAVPRAAAGVRQQPGLLVRIAAAFQALRKRLVEALREALGRDQSGQDAVREWGDRVRREAPGWGESRRLRGLLRGAAAAALPGDGRAAGEPADFDGRVRHWAGFLPETGGFARRRVQGRWFDHLSERDLHGQVEAQDGVRLVLDRAADDGPGGTALAHLDAVRGLGRAVGDEAAARVAGQLGGRDPHAYLQGLRDVAGDAERRWRDMFARGDAAMDEARADAVRARREADDAIRRVDRAIAEATLEALRRAQPFGPGDGGGLALKVTQAGTPEQRAVEWAQQFFPTAWIEAVRGRRYSLDTGDRGFFDSDARRLTLTAMPDADNGVPYSASALHELWHLFEDAIPDLQAAEWAYHWDRTSSGKVGGRRRDGANAARPLADLLPGMGHARDEVAREDSYPDPYMGREYGRDDMFEMGSMGMESLFGGSQYLDADLRDWLVGVLAGVRGE